MKRIVLLFCSWLLGICLVGCSGKEAGESQEERQEYRDIVTEREDFPSFEKLFQVQQKEHSFQYLGTQFLGEEPIQLWAELYAAEAGNEERIGNNVWNRYAADIYLLRMNGERELTATGISGSLTWGYKWYLDWEGGFYLINSHSDESALIIKLDSQGKEAFRTGDADSTAWRPRKLCQTPDQKIYVLIEEMGKAPQLAQLDPDSGALSVLDKVDLNSQNAYATYKLGSGFEGPALCGWTGFREIDTEQGDMKDVLSFNGTSYTIVGGGGLGAREEITDFRAAGEGYVEVLRTNDKGSPVYVERLKLETVQRTPIVFCGSAVDYWFKRQIARFNQENDTYYVVVEEFGLNDNAGEEQYQAALEDYASRISIQVATGKGPDILMGEDVLGGSVVDMIEKGALEDLRLHMERTGLREEDYFPMAFGAWREGNSIYGVCVNPLTYALEADRNMAGSKPDIRSMVDALLGYQEKAVYLEGVDSRELLRVFLEGSENLWGMVDWEAGTCDFSGEFFADLLEAARMYGDEPGNNLQRIAQEKDYFDFFRATVDSELEAQGLAMAGWMFDDGNHMMVEDMPLAINSGSARKEGAWEFLCFLLEREAQEDLMFYPVKREFFSEWVDRCIEQNTWSQGLYYIIGGENRVTGEWEIPREYGEKDREFVENEKVDNFVQMLEEARYLPIRPVPVLNIVCEEAENYFNGSKSAEEVAAVIENRVGLYLDERRK